MCYVSFERKCGRPGPCASPEAGGTPVTHTHTRTPRSCDGLLLKLVMIYALSVGMAVSPCSNCSVAEKCSGKGRGGEGGGGGS